MAETRRFYQPVAVNGALTVSGAITASGGLASGAAIPAPSSTRQVEVVASGDKTVSTVMASRLFLATAASGTQTFTLPLAASMPGAPVSFACGHASGEILINPNVADQISAKGLVDHSTSVKPAAGTGIKNTAATNVLGDHITLVSDGVLTWHEVSGAGIWASQ